MISSNTNSLCFHLSASKPKYTFDFSEEEGEEEDEGEEEENGEDDAMASSPVGSSLKGDSASSAAKSRYNDHQDEDEDEQDSYSALKHKPR